MTTVAIIGPGRVGTLLGTACARAGDRVIAITGGSAPSRERFVQLVAGARDIADPSQAVAIAERVILAVPDDAIAPVVTQLARDDAWASTHQVVHVCGAHGLEPLQLAARAGASVAACHPATTVPTEATDPQHLVGVAWAVTADAAAVVWARAMVERLGGDAYELAESMRPLYHAGLAVASNAAGAAVATARQLLIAARIPAVEAFIGPLVATSVRHVLGAGAEALTGPIQRGDAGTIARHLAAIDADLPELSQVYRHHARAILAHVRHSLDSAACSEIEQVLDAEPGSAGET